jgi:hypothetical protein
VTEVEEHLTGTGRAPASGSPCRIQSTRRVGRRPVLLRLSLARQIPDR